MSTTKKHKVLSLLRRLYSHFCSHGDAFNPTDLTSVKFSKMLRNSGAIDGNLLTDADVDVVFTSLVHGKRVHGQGSNIVKRSLTFDNFFKALSAVAAKRYPRIDQKVALDQLIFKHLLPLARALPQSKQSGSQLSDHKVSPQATALLKRFQAPLKNIFSSYSTLNNPATTPRVGNTALTWEEVKKANLTIDVHEFFRMCLHLDILATLLPKHELLTIFRSSTKDAKVRGRDNPLLNYPEFLTALSQIADLSFEYGKLASEDDNPTDAERLELLLRHLSRCTHQNLRQFTSIMRKILRPRIRSIPDVQLPTPRGHNKVSKRADLKKSISIAEYFSGEDDIIRPPPPSEKQRTMDGSYSQLHHAKQQFLGRDSGRKADHHRRGTNNQYEEMDLSVDNVGRGSDSSELDEDVLPGEDEPHEPQLLSAIGAVDDDGFGSEGDRGSSEDAEQYPPLDVEEQMSNLYSFPGGRELLSPVSPLSPSPPRNTHRGEGKRLITQADNEDSSNAVLSPRSRGKFPSDNSEPIHLPVRYVGEEGTVSLTVEAEKELSAIFDYYCSYGDASNRRKLSSTKFHKLVRDCQLLSNPVSYSEVALIFEDALQRSNEVNMNMMSFEGFTQALVTIAARKYSEMSAQSALSNLLLRDVFPFASRFSGDKQELEEIGDTNKLVLFQEYRRELQQVFLHYCSTQLGRLETAALTMDDFFKFSLEFEILPSLASKRLLWRIFHASKKQSRNNEHPKVSFGGFLECLGRLGIHICKGDDGASIEQKLARVLEHMGNAQARDIRHLSVLFQRVDVSGIEPSTYNTFSGSTSHYHHHLSHTQALGVDGSARISPRSKSPSQGRDMSRSPSPTRRSGDEAILHNLKLQYYEPLDRIFEHYSAMGVTADSYRIGASKFCESMRDSNVMGKQITYAEVNNIFQRVIKRTSRSPSPSSMSKHKNRTTARFDEFFLAIAQIAWRKYPDMSLGAATERVLQTNIVPLSKKIPAKSTRGSARGGLESRAARKAHEAHARANKLGEREANRYWEVIVQLHDYYINFMGNASHSEDSLSGEVILTFLEDFEVIPELISKREAMAIGEAAGVSLHPALPSKQSPIRYSVGEGIGQKAILPKPISLKVFKGLCIRFAIFSFFDYPDISDQERLHRWIVYLTTCKNPHMEQLVHVLRQSVTNASQTIDDGSAIIKTVFQTFLRPEQAHPYLLGTSLLRMCRNFELLDSNVDYMDAMHLICGTNPRLLPQQDDPDITFDEFETFITSLAVKNYPGDSRAVQLLTNKLKGRIGQDIVHEKGEVMNWQLWRVCGQFRDKLRSLFRLYADSQTIGDPRHAPRLEMGPASFIQLCQDNSVIPDIVSKSKAIDIINSFLSESCNRGDEQSRKTLTFSECVEVLTRIAIVHVLVHKDSRVIVASSDDERKYSDIHLERIQNFFSDVVFRLPDAVRLGSAVPTPPTRRSPSPSPSTQRLSPPRGSESTPHEGKLTQLQSGGTEVAVVERGEEEALQQPVQPSDVEQDSDVPRVASTLRSPPSSLLRSPHPQSPNANGIDRHQRHNASPSERSTASYSSQTNRFASVLSRVESTTPNNRVPTSPSIPISKRTPVKKGSANLGPVSSPRLTTSRAVAQVSGRFVTEEQRKELIKIFQYYCSYGDPLNQDRLRRSNLLKLVRQCQILDNQVGLNDVRRVYDSILGPGDDSGLEFEYFFECLGALACQKYPDISPRDACELIIEKHVLNCPLIAPDFEMDELLNPDVLDVLHMYSKPLRAIFNHYCSEDATVTIVDGTVTRVPKTVFLKGDVHQFLEDFAVVPGIVEERVVEDALLASSVCHAEKDALYFSEYLELLGRLSLRAFSSKFHLSATQKIDLLMKKIEQSKALETIEDSAGLKSDEVDRASSIGLGDEEDRGKEVEEGDHGRLGDADEEEEATAAPKALETPPQHVATATHGSIKVSPPSLSQRISQVSEDDSVSENEPPTAFPSPSLVQVASPKPSVHKHTLVRDDAQAESLRSLYWRHVGYRSDTTDSLNLRNFLLICHECRVLGNTVSTTDARQLFLQWKSAEEGGVSVNDFLHIWEIIALKLHRNDASRLPTMKTVEKVTPVDPDNDPNAVDWDLDDILSDPMMSIFSEFDSTLRQLFGLFAGSLPSRDGRMHPNAAMTMEKFRQFSIDFDVLPLVPDDTVEAVFEEVALASSKKKNHDKADTIHYSGFLECLGRLSLIASLTTEDPGSSSAGKGARSLEALLEHMNVSPETGHKNVKGDKLLGEEGKEETFDQMDGNDSPIRSRQVQLEGQECDVEDEDSKRKEFVLEHDGEEPEEYGLGTTQLVWSHFDREVSELFLQYSEGAGNRYSKTLSVLNFFRMLRDSRMFENRVDHHDVASIVRKSTNSEVTAPIGECLLSWNSFMDALTSIASLKYGEKLSISAALHRTLRELTSVGKRLGQPPLDALGEQLFCNDVLELLVHKSESLGKLFKLYAMARNRAGGEGRDLGIDPDDFSSFLRDFKVIPNLISDKQATQAFTRAAAAGWELLSCPSFKEAVGRVALMSYEKFSDLSCRGRLEAFFSHLGTNEPLDGGTFGVDEPVLVFDESLRNKYIEQQRNVSPQSGAGESSPETNQEAELRRAFEYYCSYDDPLNVACMDLHKLNKLCRDSGILDNRLLYRDIHHYYHEVMQNSAKPDGISFSQFIEVLRYIAGQKFLDVPLDDAVQLVVERFILPNCGKSPPDNVLEFLLQPQNVKRFFVYENVLTALFSYYCSNSLTSSWREISRSNTMMDVRALARFASDFGICPGRMLVDEFISVCRVLDLSTNDDPSDVYVPGSRDRSIDGIHMHHDIVAEISFPGFVECLGRLAIHLSYDPSKQIPFEEKFNSLMTFLRLQSIDVAEQCMTSTEFEAGDFSELLRKVFEYYCCFGDPMGKDYLSATKFHRFVGDCDLVDERFTHADVELVFVKVVNSSAKGAKMSFKHFYDALGELAIRKYHTSLSRIEAFNTLVRENVAPLTYHFEADVSPILLTTPRVLGFLDRKKKVLADIFQFYATLEVPRGTKTWEDVVTHNTTLGVDEFLSFARDFALYPQMSKAVLVKNFRASTQKADTNIKTVQMKFDEFVHCLGRIALTMFGDTDYALSDRLTSCFQYLENGKNVNEKSGETQAPAPWLRSLVLV